MHTVCLQALPCYVVYLKVEDMNFCRKFDTFGDCFCDEERRSSSRHPKTTDVRQKYFAAIIDSSFTSRAETVDIIELHETGKVLERYFVPSCCWHRRGAKKGDLVIFQVSSKEVRRQHYSKFGRIIQVLRHNAHDLSKEVLVEPLKEGAFTIDSPGCKFRDHAITIENCAEHLNGCNKIGIHITAVALEQPSKCTKLPCYRSQRFLDFNKKKDWSLEQGKIVVAISVYVHTRNGKIHDPVFTPIRIEKNYSFGDDKTLADTFNCLWSHFMGENAPRDILHTHSYHIQDIKNYPKGWKMPVLLDKIMSTFTSAVTEYIRAREALNLITKSPTIPLEWGNGESVRVLKECLGNATRCLNRVDITNDMALLELVAAGKEIHTPKRVKHFPKNYQTDVEMCSVLREDSFVKYTSPLGNFDHFVNQQILISCMTGASREIYSRYDLLGLLVVRFRSPVLRKPFVSDITETSVHFDYPETWCRIPNFICQLSFHDFSDDVVRLRDGSEAVNILLKNVSCKSEDLCNRVMVCLNGAKFEEFVTSLKGCESSSSLEKMRKNFAEMEATKTEEITPYQTAGKDTLLCLQKGVELQIQVSETDAEDNIDMGIRLLRVGRNCHFCFTHLHHPEKAFMSDRSDIRELITSETIEAFRKVKLEKKLNSTKLDNITITWNGDYEAGGYFATDVKTAVGVGDFLCIRKEVTRNEEVTYVWTCHAVVSSFQDAILSFSTCTLSQEHSGPQTDGFCVEIIRNPVQQKEVTAKRAGTSH